MIESRSLENPTFGGKNCGGESSRWEKNKESGPCYSNTLFFIDWDDTLLSSSWLAAQGLKLNTVQIPDFVWKELVVLEKHIINLLERAMTLGQVIIVTNAEAGWIELSARKFVPGVVPLLEKLRVMSARTCFEKDAPNQPQVWKQEAYSVCFTEVFGDTMDKPFYNLISLGDSNYERNALLWLTEKVSNAKSKSVKFVERPSMLQVQKELEIVSNHLNFVCNSIDEIDLMLTVEYLQDC